jgi:hypothetical protein
VGEPEWPHALVDEIRGSASDRQFLLGCDSVRVERQRQSHSGVQPLDVHRTRTDISARSSIAASLAGAVAVRLRDVLGCLDHHNIARVVKAVAIANDSWPIYLQTSQSYIFLEGTNS